MVAINQNKLQRVSTRGQSGVFQSTNTPIGAFGVRDTVQHSAGPRSFLGEAVGNIGDDLSKIALQMQQEDNETEAKAADARIADRIRKLNFGDPNDPSASEGYLAAKGKNALDRYGDTEEQIRQAVAEEMEAASGNPALTSLIQRTANQRVNAALDRMSGHASDQRLAYQIQTSEARIAQAHADVTADYLDDGTLARAKAIAAAEVADQAQANGLSPEAADVLLASKQGVVIKGAFDAALTGQDTKRAQAIFSQNADLLDGPTRQVMAESLAADVQLETAQSLASEALTLYPADPAAARKFIRDAVDGKQEAAAMQELNARTAEIRGDVSDRRAAWRFAEAMRKAQKDRNQANREVAAQEASSAAESALPEGSLAQRVSWVRENYSGDTENDAIAYLSNIARIEEIEPSQDRAAENARRATEAEAYQDLERKRLADARAKKKREEDARAEATRYFLDTNPDIDALKRDKPQVFDILSSSGDYSAMQNFAINVAKGKLFASSSDGETMHTLRKTPPHELMQVRLDALQHKLTITEYAEASRLVAGAEADIKRDKESRGVFDAGRAAIQRMLPAKMRENKGKQSVIDQVVATNSEMTAWIEEYHNTNGSYPPFPEIEKKAAELTTPASATSFFGRPFYEDDDDWAGIVGAVSKMSDEQRSIVRIPIESIGRERADEIYDFLTTNYPSVDVESLSDGDWEEFAGALAARDEARMRRLAEDL